MLPDKIPVYVVVGSDPDHPAKALEIFMERPRADAYVLDGTMQAAAMHRGGMLSPGEQVSMILTIGRDDESSMTTASLVVLGDDHRHVWDFRVEKRWGQR